MKDRFVTRDFVLDLSTIKISYVETNPRFKDTFFTKYSFPFEFYLSRDLKVQMGDYTNINAKNLLKKHKGYHIFEGHKKEGVLEIIEVEGDLVRAQVDSGFEDFPNFDKKLNEIPFDIIEVDDIYTHAEDVCKKSYPEVNYNFPRVIYTKHLNKKDSWEYFNQFLNDRDENGFVRNGENETEHVNRNIIHPMPYLLYALKKGFADAGYELAGDILEDTDFKQRVIYNNKEMFYKNEHEAIDLFIKETDKVSGEENMYEKEVVLDKKGTWLLQATAECNQVISMSETTVEIYLNGTPIYGRGNTFGSFRATPNLELKNTVENGVLRVVMRSHYRRNEPIFTGSVNLKSYLNVDNQSIFHIRNSNTVNISNSMPNMTFGELVKTIKNWKNYDLDIIDDKVYMNRLVIRATEMVDISDFEVAKPIKKFGHKRSFQLSFIDMDKEEDNFDKVLINSEGLQLNGVPDKNTTELKINGYCLPIETFRGKTTAIPKKDDDSVLGLIYYDGLHNNQNLAQNPPGLMLPNILDTWYKWFKMRINSSEIRWSFIVNKNKFRHINVKDTLYGYHQKLWIKEITKTVLDKKNYKVDIVTEVVR